MSSRSVFEDRFALKEVSNKDGKLVLEGVRNLEAYWEGARGIFGGELLAQAINAAWKSVDGDDLRVHLFHTYFVKPGSNELVIVWHVRKVNDTKNYANRLVEGYQSVGGNLITVFQVQFTRNNSHKLKEETYENTARQLAAQGKPVPLAPLWYQKKPNKYFYKYVEEIDDMPYINHTHGLLDHVFLPELMFGGQRRFDPTTAGNEEFGFFCRVSDDWRNAARPVVTKYLQLAYLSDAFLLGVVIVALGILIPLSLDDPLLAFMRVTLDHNVYYHDDDFDPSAWLFFDIKYERYSSDRIFVKVSVYSLQGRMVATIILEGLIYLTEAVLSKVRKFNRPEKI